MQLNYFDVNGVEHLVEEIFELSFSEDDMPFNTTIVPVCLVAITYIYGKGQSALYNRKTFPLEGSILSGQFYGTYELNVQQPGSSFGITFHPTAFHKLTNLDISTFSNKHIPLKNVCSVLYEELNPIFLEDKSQPKILIENLKIVLNKFELQNNHNINCIDECISIIKEKEGMVTVLELLENVPLSQKTLETQFKKIVGLTPGKYIRMYRFLKLMRKYGSGEIDIKDLLYMYNYHDASHFSKDFKQFMKQTPKSYFKTDYPLLREYLNHDN